LEVAALILSAGLHDIGMVPSQQEVESLLAETPAEACDHAQSRYRAFREGYAQLIGRQQELRARGLNSQADQIEAFLLSEYIRQSHAERGRDYIFGHYARRLKYGNYDFTARPGGRNQNRR
jgi:hypothetical protein